MARGLDEDQAFKRRCLMGDLSGLVGDIANWVRIPPGKPCIPLGARGYRRHSDWGINGTVWIIHSAILYSMTVPWTVPGFE